MNNEVKEALKELLKEATKEKSDEECAVMMKDIYKAMGIEALTEEERNEIDKRVKELYDENAICFIAVSNKGIIQIGQTASLLTSLTLLVQELIKCDTIDIDDILKSVKEGLQNE